MQQDNSTNNKRIAKNTFALYFRMIIVTIISLFTARLTLQLLGVEDYGIYNVVAGIIGFVNIIKETMVSSTQRFFSYALGEKNLESYRKTFSMALIIFAVLCIIIILLMELIGPYVISHYLVIPQERLNVAQWLFQFTIISFVVSTFSIPFRSSIVAYEKISIYAYFSILDVIVKLAIVYFLYITPFDQLLSYGFLSLLAVILNDLLVAIYCYNKLEGCRYHLYWDKNLFKKLTTYSGWSMFGSTTGVMIIYGQTLVLNIFFGPIVNAAKAIADKINGIIYSFVTNFYMAVSPQIVKTYASHDYEYTKKLVIMSTKYGYSLLCILSLPLIFDMKDLLILWLGRELVTSDMVIFCQLVLVYSLINCFEPPITFAVRATGNIKKYQVGVGSLTLLFIPLCCVIFKMGAPAYYSMVLLSLIYFVALFYRLWILKGILPLEIREYIKRLLFPLLSSTLLSTVLIMLINFNKDNIWFLLLSLIINALITIVIFFLVVLNNQERVFVIRKIQSRIFNTGIK